MNYTKEELNQTGIYAIINLNNGKKYIGSAARGFRHRWHTHKSDLKRDCHHSSYLQNSWNKYGESNFEFKIIEVVPKEEWTDNKYLLDIEQMYLDTFQPEYNILPTAGSNLGMKTSEETKRKLSLAMKGKKQTEEVKLNRSIARRPQGYSFIHRETGETCIFHNLKQFCRERNLNPGHMGSVDRGNRKHHNGWLLYNPETSN